MTITIVITDKLPPGHSLESLWGAIPHWLNENDPRPAREQLDEHYRHGGGWDPQPGFTRDEKTGALKYPGDPKMKVLSTLRFRDELITVHACEYFCITQKDGSFEVCRMD